MTWLANDYIDPKNVVPDDEDGDIEDSDEDESTPRLNIDDDDLEEKTEVKNFKKSLGKQETGYILEEFCAMSLTVRKYLATTTP